MENYITNYLFFFHPIFEKDLLPVPIYYQLLELQFSFLFSCILLFLFENFHPKYFYEEAVHYFLDHQILYGPGKAANAGGVATSGLEMSQNSIRQNWNREKVDYRLKEIMIKIHHQCKKYGKGEFQENINYYKGANIAGFVKVAEAMLAQGVV